MFEEEKEEAKVYQNSEERKAKDSFLLEDVNKHWNQYLNQLKTKTDLVSYNALMAVEVSLLESEKIGFSFNSESHKSQFEFHREKYVLDLRKSLNNDFITLETVINDRTETNQILSKKERFEEMLQKNPMLGQLAQDLGLDYYD